MWSGPIKKPSKKPAVGIQETSGQDTRTSGQDTRNQRSGYKKPAVRIQETSGQDTRPRRSETQGRRVTKRKLGGGGARAARERAVRVTGGAPRPPTAARSAWTRMRRRSAVSDSAPPAPGRSSFMLGPGRVSRPPISFMSTFESWASLCRRSCLGPRGLLVHLPATALRLSTG